MAFVRELLQNILAVRRAVNNVPVRQTGIEHCKPVMVFASYRDVFHARRLCECDPCACIELGRIETRREWLVISNGHLSNIHYPFPVAENAVNAPVNEEPELRVLKPLSSSEILCGRLVTVLAADNRRRQENYAKKSGNPRFSAKGISHASYPLFDSKFGSIPQASGRLILAGIHGRRHSVPNYLTEEFILIEKRR